MPIFTKMFCMMLALLHTKESLPRVSPPPVFPSAVLVSSNRGMTDFSDLQRLPLLGRVLGRGSASFQTLSSKGCLP